MYSEPSNKIYKVYFQIFKKTILSNTSVHQRLQLQSVINI